MQLLQLAKIKYIKMFSYFYLVNLLDLLHCFLAGLVTFKVVLAKLNEVKCILYMYLYPAIVMKVIW